MSKAAKTASALALVTVILCLTPLASAQEARGISEPQPRRATAAPERWALFIGVGKYDDEGLLDLPNAVRDASALRDAFIEAPDGFPESNVLFLADNADSPLHLPSRSNILASLRSWGELAGPEDTLLVYFAGHGIESAGRLYLMPSNGRITAVEETGIAFERFAAFIKESNAQNTLIILDACHSGAGRSANAMSSQMMEDIARNSEGHITLSSCREDEKSYEYDQNHGAFTWFLLQALSGQADANRDGLLTATEVSDYTYNETRQWAARKQLKQNPKLMTDISGNIVLASVPGRGPIRQANDPTDLVATNAPALDARTASRSVPVSYVSEDATVRGVLLDTSKTFASSDRFRDNGDDTIYDGHLGVEWQKISMGVMSFQQAENACNNMATGGKSNWRLPRLDEIQTLIALQPDGKWDINAEFFVPNNVESRYWTADQKRSVAMTVNLATRMVVEATKSNHYAVRAVRDLN